MDIEKKKGISKTEAWNVLSIVESELKRAKSPERIKILEQDKKELLGCLKAFEKEERLNRGENQ